MSDREMRTRVGPSSIAGRGLFALEGASRGAILLRYAGRLQSRKEAVHDDRYLFEIDAERWLDGNCAENAARYINHGCEPNCEAVWQENGLRIRTLREIAAGEELLLDYGYQPAEALGRRCRCGAAHCIGYMVGRPWRGAFLRLLSQLRRRRNPSVANREVGPARAAGGMAQDEELSCLLRA